MFSKLGVWRQRISALVEVLSTNPSVDSLNASGNVTAGSITIAGSVTHGDDTVFTRDDFTPLVTPADEVTTLFSFALDAYQEATYDIAVVVQCRKTDGSTASYRRAATFKSVGGVVSQVDTTEEPYSKADLALAACVATIDTSGGLVRVRVTGIAATSLTWTGGYESALTEH